MMSKYMKIVVVTLVLCPLSGLARGNWLVGGGLVVVPNPFINKSTTVLPVPMAQYEGERVQIETGQLRYAIIKGEDWRIFSQATVRFEGFDPQDSAMSGMGERKGTVEGGFGVLKSGIWGVAHLGFTTDLAGVHNGYSVGGRYEFSVGEMNWRIQPYLGASFRSRKLVDYYYGVRADEAELNRPEYHAGGSFNLYLGANTYYKLRTRLWSVVGLHVERLGSAIQNSPIVDKELQIVGIIGVMYEI